MFLAACAPQAAQSPNSDTTSGLRLVPSTTAAAELLKLLVGPEDVLALPTQVDRYSVDDFQTGPWQAKPRFPSYDAEVLLAMRPSRVISHRWQSMDTTRVLQQAGVPVLSLESGTSYASVRTAIETLGRELGREALAQAALADLDRRVAALRTRAPAAQWRALVYAHDGTSGWVAAVHTTSDTMLQLVGLRNAAVEFGWEGHAACSMEQLLALDPDLLIVSTATRGESGTPTRQIVETTAALSSLRARTQGRIVELPGTLLSSDSHHIVAAAEALAERLATLPK